MLSYKQLTIDVLYDTVNNDLLEEFYAPILENSIEYKRASCYFSLDTLLYMAKPLSYLLKNRGTAKFIISFEISNKDFDNYQEFSKIKIDTELEKQINEAILSPEGIDINLKNLAYLIKMRKLEIKVALKKSGLFHEKFAICKDFSGNKIGFIGSLNETIYGMKENTESITVRKSYSGSSDDVKFIDIKNKQFDELWRNEYPGHRVFDIAQAVEEKFLKICDDHYTTLKTNFQVSGFIYLKKEKHYYLEGDIEKFVVTNRYYNTKIKPLIINTQKNKLILKSISNYITLKKIIYRIKEYSESNNIKFIVSNDIVTYLLENDIFIERRRELGTYIKNKDPYIINDFNKFKKIVNINLKRELKESQLWDAFHCAQMVKSSNYSVPGTGKTAMILGAFYYLKSIGKVSKLIVCGPLNSRKSWRDEISLMFYDDMLKFIDVRQFNSSNKQRNEFFKDQISYYDVIFLNHDSLFSLEYQLENYNNKSYFICFDEMHKFKGYDSKRASLAVKLFKDNIYKSSLTGTPNPNGFEDFYSQLNIIYTHEYDMFFGYTVDDLRNINNDPKEISKFNKIYQPFFCRTTKNDLLIKPPLDDNIIKVPMTEVEQEIYDELLVRLSKNKLLMYIRMIQLTTIPHCINNTLDSETVQFITTDNEEYINDIQDFEFTKIAFELVEKAKSISNPSKIVAGIDFIQDMVVNKKRNLIVWAIFKETHSTISRKLTELGIESKIINGDISVDEREEVIERFKSLEFDVLIANPHTMAESVSLHLHCHDALYIEFDFNLTHNLQSRDRIHRLGLSNDIDTRYHYLVSTKLNNKSESADQYIYKRLSEKREQMLSIVESELIDTIPVDNIHELLNLLV